MYPLGSYRIGEKDDPEARWTEDQRGAEGPRGKLETRKIGKVNVTWWRRERAARVQERGGGG